MALSGTGHLKSLVDKIRLYSNNPATEAKFSDSNILDLIRTTWAQIILEHNNTAQNKIYAKLDITVVADQQDYVLPPTVQWVTHFAKMSTETLRPNWELVQRDELSVFGPGFRIDGPNLHLDPVWKSGETLQFKYIPNGEASLFEATTAVGGWDTSTGLTITAPASVTDGTLDTRAHAYAGYILRVLSTTDSSNNYQQERVITAYNNQTRVFTFAPALDPIPVDGGSDTITFEVVPAHAYLFEDAIAYRVAAMIATSDESNQVETRFQRRAQSILRNINLAATQINSRIATYYLNTDRTRNRNIGVLG